MKQIRDLVGRELKWVQPHALRSEFELRDGEEVVATLRFRSLLGSRAVAESADGSWTFKRVGFWQTRVTIRARDADEDLAVFRNNTWKHGGTLELADGRQLRANSNFWMTEYAFTTDADAPVVHYRRVGGALHLSSMVEIESAGAPLAELPWLVALGWYLTVMMIADTSAAAAAAG